MFDGEIMAGPIPVFLILGGLFVALAWGRYRYDLVAFATLLAAVLVGAVPVESAFSGFGHPATVTVALVLIISRALASTGAIDVLVRTVLSAAGNTSYHVGVLSAMGASLSTFMNNVGALGLLMPAALQSALKAKRSPALLLMPLSFGSILGGLVTLIGTPPNIIVSGYRWQLTGEAFGMFDYTPVGFVVAALGVTFVAFVGWRLVPKRALSRGTSDDPFQIEDYVAEALVPADSDLVGLTLDEVLDRADDIEAQVLALIRGQRRYGAPQGRERLQKNDVVVIEAGPEEIDKFAAKLGLQLGASRGARANLENTRDAVLVEAVVPPDAWAEGATLRSLRLPSRYGVTTVALSRQGKQIRGRLRDVRYRVGDVALLYGDADRIGDAVTRMGFLPLAQRDLSFGQRDRARDVLVIFGCAIALASLGLLSVPIALALAAAVIVATGLISPRDLYQGIDWPVIVLLGALIPVGSALQSTGGTDMIADGILWLTRDLAPWVVVLLLMVITMSLSDVLNNAATAVVMAPIGAGIAQHLGVSADPFLMAVAVGASCAFLTPIGHQNNALIMGPGGYSFGDYWRMGLPLEVIVVAVATPLILIVWPF